MKETKLSKKELAHYNKYLDIDACIDLFSTIWAVFIPFGTIVGILKSNLTKITNEIHVILGYDGSQFDTKIANKKILSTYMAAKCKILLGYCALTDNTDLVKKFKHTYSSLFELPDNELTVKCENIKGQIELILGALVDYNIDAATITEMELLISNFVNSKESVTTTIDLKKVDHNRLRKLFKTHEKHIVTSLNLVVEFIESEPKFYYNYLVANQLTDPAYDNVSIYSNIKDKITQESIAEASVIIELLQGTVEPAPVVKFEKLTNLQGYFQWKDLPSGLYKLTLKRFAYKLLEMEVEIVHGKITKPEIFLERE